jgi:hypothetical protein
MENYIYTINNTPAGEQRDCLVEKLLELDGGRHAHLLRGVEDISVTQQVKIVTALAEYIIYLKKPCPEAQMVAVKKDFSLLGYIKNPSDVLVKYAIRRNHNLLYAYDFIDKIKPEVLYYFSRFKYFDEGKLWEEQRKVLKVGKRLHIIGQIKKQK